MIGQIAIVKEDRSNLSIFEMFKIKLGAFCKPSDNAGWYAMKEEDGVVYFKFCSFDEFPSKNRLEYLKKEGWTLG